METWMIEKLEKLRKEQNPACERPALRLPVPLPPPSEKKESEPKRERGVVVIDMCV